MDPSEKEDLDPSEKDDLDPSTIHGRSMDPRTQASRAPGELMTLQVVNQKMHWWKPRLFTACPCKRVTVCVQAGGGTAATR